MACSVKHQLCSTVGSCLCARGRGHSVAAKRSGARRREGEEAYTHAEGTTKVRERHPWTGIS